MKMKLFTRKPVLLDYADFYDDDSTDEVNFDDDTYERNTCCMEISPPLTKMKTLMMMIF